jgi:hypothetical protein
MKGRRIRLLTFGVMAAAMITACQQAGTADPLMVQQTRLEVVTDSAPPDAAIGDAQAVLPDLRTAY